MIKDGNKIRIKENLSSELTRMGFPYYVVESFQQYVGTTQTAYNVYEQDGEKMITIDLCVEIPFNCCEKI